VCVEMCRSATAVAGSVSVALRVKAQVADHCAVHLWATHVVEVCPNVTCAR
jgi:hypothetical protein